MRRRLRLSQGLDDLLVDDAVADADAVVDVAEVCVEVGVVIVEVINVLAACAVGEILAAAVADAIWCLIAMGRYVDGISRCLRQLGFCVDGRQVFVVAKLSTH